MPTEILEQCFKPEAAQALGENSRAHWSIVGVDADNGQCHAGAPSAVYRFDWMPSAAN
jgi:hypothetical protein